MQATKPPLSSACHQGIKTHLYLIGKSTEGNCFSAYESLLDDLLLCAIIGGEKDLLNLFNDKWNLRENLLFCIATGEKESCQSQLITSPAIPMHGLLILVNMNPVEYGHIFLVPYGKKQRQEFWHKEMFYLISRLLLPVEQDAYFANHLPVELLPVINVYDCKDNKGAGYVQIADALKPQDQQSSGLVRSSARLVRQSVRFVRQSVRLAQLLSPLKPRPQHTIPLPLDLTILLVERDEEEERRRDPTEAAVNFDEGGDELRRRQRTPISER
ncbi:uncharacterized protein A4U43_C07F12850 [Asparagus officinalis]|uniref:GDPGP1-like N-terminal domain-containing protein n=1 Tax=Asparagus officinalis TaxID=4686 RepID=A0A5P1EBK8_ASPOF|nr:uncharacterized protein A4U43_C07F12850 [Asparagus officinalis]